MRRSAVGAHLASESPVRVVLNKQKTLTFCTKSLVKDDYLAIHRQIETFRAVRFAATTEALANCLLDVHEMHVRDEWHIMVSTHERHTVATHTWEGLMWTLEIMDKIVVEVNGGGGK